MLRHVVSGIDKDKVNSDEEKKNQKKIKKKTVFAEKYKHSDSGSKNYNKVKTWTLPALCQAVCNRDVNKVTQLLMLEPRKHLYERDNNQRTALHYASFYDYYGILALLLESQYSNNILEARDDAGKTPLFKAAETTAIASLKLLLSMGCNPTTYDITGTTPLHVAVLAQNLELMDILLTARANSNSIDQLGFSPLHICCGLGFVEGIRLLLLHNAHPNAKDKKGRTPLFAAASEHRTKVTNILLKHGANPNIVDDEGKTPIRHSIEKEKQAGQYKQRRQSERRSVHVMGSTDHQFDQHHNGGERLTKYDAEVMTVMSPGDLLVQSNRSSPNRKAEKTIVNGSDVIGSTLESFLPGYVPMTRNNIPRGRKILRKSFVKKEIIPDSMLANHPNSLLLDTETENDYTDISLSLDSEGPMNSKYLLSTSGHQLFKSAQVENSETEVLNESDLTPDDGEAVSISDREPQLTVSDGVNLLPLEEQKLNYLYEKNCELLGKKLKRCKVLQTRMNGLLDNLELPEPPIATVSARDGNSMGMVHEENEVLHREILILRKKNAELNNHALQYKHQHLKPNVNPTEDYNLFTNPDSQLQIDPSVFAMGSLQRTIDELMQENVKIKQEVQNLNLHLTSIKPHSEELIETKQHVHILTKQIEQDKVERRELSDKVSFLQEENANLSGRLSMLSNTIVDSKVLNTTLAPHDSHRKKKSRRAPLPPGPPVLKVVSYNISPTTEVSRMENVVKEVTGRQKRKISLWDSIRRELPKLRSLDLRTDLVDDDKGKDRSVTGNHHSNGGIVEKRSSNQWKINI